MANEQYIAAIEIASSKIVGAIGTKDADGRICFRMMEEDKVVDCVSHGLSQNIEEISQHLNNILVRLESRIAPRRIESVYVGLSGGGIRSIQRHSRLDFGRDEIIENSHLLKLARMASQETFQDFEKLDVVPRCFFINGEEKKRPIGILSNAIEADYNIIIGKKALRSNIGHVLGRINREEKDAFITSITTADLILTEADKQGCAFVDYGAENVTISIYRRGTLCHLYTLPFGSRNITMDIAEGLHQVEGTAEELKKQNDSLLRPTSVASRGLNGNQTASPSNYVIARSGEIVANIINAIKCAGFEASDLPSGLIFTGGGAKSADFSEYVQGVTKFKVRIATLPQNISVVDSRATGLEYLGIVSLIVAGGQRLQPNESCCSNPYLESEIQESPESPENPEEPESPAEPKPQKKNIVDKLFTRLKSLADSLSAENVEEDDEDEERR